MNLQTDVFKRVLEKLGTVVGKNTVLPITQNVLIKANPSETVFECTDAERSIRITEPMSNIDTWNICVPFQILSDTIKTINEPIIELVVQEDVHKMTLKAGKGKYVIMGESPDDFPLLKGEKSGNKIVLSSEDVIKAIEKTFPFTSSDQIRLAMTGINVAVKNSVVRFSSTDANMLSSIEIKVGKTKQEVNKIIPKKISPTLKESLKGTESVEIYFNENRVLFSTEKIEIEALYISATFPDLSKFFEEREGSFTVQVQRLSFLQSLKRLKIYSNTITSVAIFDVKKESIHTSTEDIDFQKSADEQLPCISQKEMKIGLNIKYMESILSAMDGETVTIYMKDPSAFIMTKEEDEKTKHNMALMPVSIIN